MRNIKLFIALLLLFGYSIVHAQKTVTHQDLFWIRYHNVIRFDPKIIWHNEIEERRFFEGGQHHHFIMHSRLHYKFDPRAEVGAGITYSLQSPQFPNSVSDLVVPEIRLVQEINYSTPLSKRIGLHQRFRVDERFIRTNNGMELLDGYTFNWRFRFRVMATFRLNENVEKNNTILKVFDELMVNAGSSIVFNQFDQNRIYVGIEQILSKKISVELGYLKWYQQTAAGDLFFNRNIIRLTLVHNITLHND